MTLHKDAFSYLKPTDDQLFVMSNLRQAFADFADVLDTWLPDGPDKTYVLRHLRDTAMWTNIAITRNPDGSPRT